MPVFVLHVCGLILLLFAAVYDVTITDLYRGLSRYPLPIDDDDIKM